MKWFTRGWHAGELTDAESQRIEQAYRDHVAHLAGRVDPPVAVLSQDINLHDAVIETVELHSRERRLVLRAIAGDLQQGYRAITLDLGGVELGDRERDMLRRRARDRDTAILQHEVDVELDGTYVLRLLFWPEGEVSVRFRQLTLDTAPRADRRLLLSGFFVEHD